MWGAPTILKVAVPRFSGPCVTLISVSARPARCSPNVPTLAEVQPSCSAITRPAPLEGQVIDDANVFSEKLQEWVDYYNYTLTAFLAAKHLTSAFVRKPKTRCHRPSSVCTVG
jgi:hypothetical protein